MNVAIVALGGSSQEYVMTRINSHKFDEVWGINSIGAIFNVDRTFMMDPASRFLDGIKAGKQTGIAQEFLLKTPNKGPIYSCCKDERVPEIELYPLDKVVKKAGHAYFNNTVAYALAYAIYKEVESINLYGIDFSYKENINFAEAGRACCEFWCAIALRKGIKVNVVSTVQVIQDGKLIVMPESEYEKELQEELRPPEPLDGKEPVLIGKHDIPGVTYV